MNRHRIKHIALFLLPIVVAVMLGSGFLHEHHESEESPSHKQSPCHSCILNANYKALSGEIKPVLFFTFSPVFTINYSGYITIVSPGLSSHQNKAPPVIV